MLRAVMQEAKSRNNILYLVLAFIFFFGLYVFLDFEGNTNYRLMNEEFGLGIVSIHIFINIIIAMLSSVMVIFSIINFKLTKIEPKGSNAIPFFTFIFGLLTFGCTGCVVAFFSAVGIAFSPIILPNGNLLWKLLALLLVVIGFTWIMYSIEHTKCKIKKIGDVV
jgi:hypothetical protein